ncbi:MAG: T9SS type A sorting domain-containing protein [Aequorivita antarctica]
MKNISIFFLVFFILSINLLWAQTHTWTGGAGSDVKWSNPANWDAGTIPNSNSNVLIPGGFFPEIMSQPAFANTISMQSTTQLLVKNNLTFSGDFTVETEATLRFEKGFLQGGGTIVNNGTFHFNSFETKDIGNITIENNNIIFVEDSGVVHFHNTVLINNNTGAEINILSNGGFIENTSDDVTLNNYGILKKLPFPNGAGGAYYLIFDINNFGIIETGENQTFLILTGSQNFNNTEDGILIGTGGYDITSNFTNFGKISPGKDTTAGTLQMVNNVNLSTPGTLEIDINDPSENDMVEVFGTPDLQGDIAVTLGYGPDLGDEFTILTASNGINTCDFPAQVSAPFGPFDTYIFDVICNNNSIVLKVETILLDVTGFENSPFDFYVYPNPVKDSAEIYFSSTETNSQYEELSISVYNMLGQKVKHIEGFSEEDISFKKENFSSGIYFLHLKNKEQLLATTKIVVE